MNRKMTAEETEKLKTFTEEWRKANPDGSQQECAIDAQKVLNFPNYNIRTFTLNKCWGACASSGSKTIEKAKRKYTRKMSGIERLAHGEGITLEEAPSLAGLIKKIEDLKEYASKLSDHQKKQLEKLFLV